MLIGISFAVLTWVLLYGTTGGGLIMLLGALSYPVAFGGLVWAAGWIRSFSRRYSVISRLEGCSVQPSWSLGTILGWARGSSVVLAYGSSS
jgi:hypothetical protein